jgi:hypothetical protein
MPAANGHVEACPRGGGTGFFHHGGSELRSFCLKRICSFVQKSAASAGSHFRPGRKSDSCCAGRQVCVLDRSGGGSGGTFSRDGIKAVEGFSIARRGFFRADQQLRVHDF